MLRLSDARALIMHPADGHYSGSNKETRQGVDKHFRTAIEYLHDPFVQELKHSDYKKLWTALAHAHKADPRQSGPRAAEATVANLRHTITWLAERNLIPRGYGQIGDHWKDEYRKDWHRITGNTTKSPEQATYNAHEVAKLWKSRSKAEP